MASNTAVGDIRVKGLGRQKRNALAAKAKRLGMTSEAYVKQLVEEDLAISHEARTKTFTQIMGPGREIDETELDQLVDRARTEHHARKVKKGR